MIEEEFAVYVKNPSEKYVKMEKPNIFIGCNIKSKYDEKRIKIKDDLNPIRVSHNDRCFYGCSFQPIGQFLNLIKDISVYKSLDLYSYGDILKKNNLSCDENFAYFSNGIYPIDSIHISKYISNFNYKMFFDELSEIPLHQKIKSVNMFLFK